MHFPSLPISSSMDCFTHVITGGILERDHGDSGGFRCYINLWQGLSENVKLYTCQLFYDHLINKKLSNLYLSLVYEQHNYAAWSASLQHLNPESSE